MASRIERLRRLVTGVALGWSILAAPAALAQGAPHALMENFQVGENVYVRALAIDEGRRAMWVGTSVGAMEIDLAKREVKNSFTRKDGLANEYVFAVGVQPNGPVWFGTNAGGVSTWQNDKWKTYFPMHGLADYWVYCFAFDKAGGTWIGTWDGANYVPPGGGRFVTYRSELINVWVYGLDIDATGRVWFGTEGGVSMYDGKTWKSWTATDGLGARNIQDLPRSANTGLGTRTRHDLVVETEGNETYNPNYVFSVLADARGGSIWFGTWGGGVSRFDGDSRWQSFSTADGLAGNIVYSIAQDKEGGLWFGTNRGVSHYDGSRWTSYGKADGLLGDNVYAIAVAPDGSLWFGSRGGVSRLLRRK